MGHLPHRDGDGIHPDLLGAGAVACLFCAVISETEAKVIRMRFGLEGMVNHTLQQVADSMDISKQRVHQIEQAALKKMSRSEVLYSFWREYGGD
ncbi:RNA polymerase sigma-70 subunit RpoD [uncultured Mediterranean phage uvMED]|nr:RNA polymerase sigma-70 subunit RpoD [uncultured Mediterranean phage uvMED]